MDERNNSSSELTVNSNHSVVFPIKLINKFDDVKRNIRVWQKDKKTTLYHVASNEKHKQKGFILSDQRDQRKEWDEAMFWLDPEDTEDFLIVEFDEAVVDFSEITRDIYIELPFVADYTLFFEISDKGKIKGVDRPITYITRNTAENQKIPTEKGKTVVRIPGDQIAWKLKISSPKNWKEHMQTKNLLIEYCHNSGGTGDSASVGDNGP